MVFVSKKDNSHQSIVRRMRPALCFIMAIFLLAVIAFGTGYGAPPPVEQRYARAKAEVEALKSDAKRNTFRANWTNLVKEFDDIYKLDPKWANRGAALFQAALTTEELAKHSHSRSDLKEAADRFESLALKHSSSKLADDALYRAAVIRGKQLNDKKAALAVLKRLKNQYPKSDMRAKAIALEEQLEGNASAAKEAPKAEKAAAKAEKPAPKGSAASNAKTPPQADLSQVSWNTLDKKRVQLIIELDRQAPYKITIEQGNAAKRVPARLQLSISNTRVQAQMKSGARVSGSLLTKVAIADSSAGHAVLTFDFSKLGTYTTKMEQKPFRIIITVMADGVMQKNERDKVYGLAKGEAWAEVPTEERAPIKQVALATEDLAEQLGLTVETVLIDPGHGGKDPGTTHNNIVERDTVLDISKRVGRLLADNGLEVEFSRKTDVYVPLTTRTRMATDKKVDLFLSIHVNAHKDVNFDGFETYYLDMSNHPQSVRVASLENAASQIKLGDMQAVVSKIMLNAKSSESRRLAIDLQRAAVSRIKKSGYNVRDGGVKGAPFHVLIGAPMPSVLVEVGYCTNAQEAKNLLSAQYRQKIAEGIAEGVLAYRNRLQKRSSAELGTQKGAM